MTRDEVAVITEEPPIIDGDRVAIVADIAGTHVGELLGIVRERRLYDFTGLLVQIDLLRAKPV